MKNFKYETENNKLTITGYEGTDGNLNIPSEIDGKPVTSIGDFAFYFADHLISVTIPGTITSIGNHAFDGCNRLKSINVDSNNADYGSIDGVLFNKNKTKLICYPVGNDHVQYNIPNSVTSIGDYAFNQSCPTILKIPNSVKSIGRHVFDGYYYGTTRHIYYEGHEQQWLQCIVDKTDEWLSSINLRVYYEYNNYIYNILDGKVIITNYMGRTDTVLNIPSEIEGKPVTSIGDSAFDDCSSLKCVTIPDSVKSIGSHAFEYCTNLISVTISNSVTSIGDYAFIGCSSLTCVTIPNNVTDIGSHTFENCSSLKCVTIPDSMTAIEDHVFDGCSSLTNINIPHSVTYIGSYAFYGCDNLTNVTIPDSVKYIGWYAFYYCTGMRGCLKHKHSLFLGRGNEHLKK